MARRLRMGKGPVLSKGAVMRVVGLGALLAYGAGYGIHRLHAGLHEQHEIAPVLHWLRDSTLGLPAAVVAVLVTVPLARVLLRSAGLESSRAFGRVVWVLLAGSFYALASIPGNDIHARLFGAEHQHDHEQSFLAHTIHDASAMLALSTIVLLAGAFALGAPWERRPPAARLLAVLRARPPRENLLLAAEQLGTMARTRMAPIGISTALALVLVAVIAPRVDFAGGATPGEPKGCAGFDGSRTLEANVVALDQPFEYNRLGVANPYGMIFALRRDVVSKTSGLTPGNVTLREGKRPRPLVLRMNVGDCLVIHFQNLLSETRAADQPADRHVSLHVNGMQLADPDGNGAGLEPIASDGSYVGKNPSSLVAPGGTHDYAIFAEYENTYLLYSTGAVVGGEGGAAAIAEGLFGAVNVEPFGTDWYRSQLSRVDMDLATPAETYEDTNDNGTWDAAVAPEPFTGTSGNGALDAAVPAEPFTDANGNGEWDAAATAEPFTDANGNGEWDAAVPAEPFTDANTNGEWDAAVAADTFTDTNGNGGWDAAGPAEPFTDANTNGEWDAAVAADTFTDTNGNGSWDAAVPAEPFTDTNGNGRQEGREPFTDTNGNGSWDAAIPAEPLLTDTNGNGEWDAAVAAEPFTDTNGNGSWDAVSAEPLLTDTNGNGSWDAAVAAEPFTDTNTNGIWDAAVPAEPFTDVNTNGSWDAAVAAEPFTDTNGNGTWDATVPAEPSTDTDTALSAVAEPFTDTNENGTWDEHATTPDGQPILDYQAEYPDGTPILRMLKGNEIVHSDLTAVIAGKPENDYRILPQSYPDSYWANEVYNQYRESGGEPFREFTIVFHDEIKAIQAFPEFSDPVLQHTLHGVKDGFAINYGTGGIGAEILANRKALGPMWDCVDCKYEEFFLSAWAVGDPATIVDKPANQTLAAGGPGGVNPGGRATKALYPDDPSNVYHSYLNDRVKFRNLHAGPKEHHVFHLHAHQWQFDWNEKHSSYLDSQNIGPGGGFTYEIANGGSGNRNKTIGDSIFHCHFYPHFAQGMWAMWRTHDTFERGTVLDVSGTPVEGARALPDGEITAGTPIPGLVPLPGSAMAPMPNPDTTVVAYDLNNDGVKDSSQVDVDGDGTAGLAESGGPFDEETSNGNPGYPFFVPGIAGHRPPTPPKDMPVDGGLPRHEIIDGEATSFQTRLDLNKTLEKASVVYLPEDGTPAEVTAMDYHAELWHPTFSTAGDPVSTSSPLQRGPSSVVKGFETNGLPPVAGAPFAEPCRPDRKGDDWVDPVAPLGDPVELDPVGNPRTYKAAVIELDMTLNKLGWHFPQQRILALNEDAGDTLTGKRAPQPLVMRLAVGDCTNFEHTNLVPNVYELDDFQVRTPTDIIGQHIHLVKFDVMSADGSANGFNYEDGTLSPEEVEERIHAIRAETEATGPACGNGDNARLDHDDETPTPECPLAEKHPYFGNVAGVGDLAWGARTTVQRWYADPLLNDAWDQGLGTVFTHDHYGPSTHQQVGLYATVLVEPGGTKWSDPQTGAEMGSRGDGGPTSWRADISFTNGSNEKAFREFYLEYADFQHAYQPGKATQTRPSTDPAGAGIPTFDDFLNSINPSVRSEPPSGHENDLYFFPPTCPGGVPRPCPEAISAEDPGTYVVNYRNEPIAARVYDPQTKTQAAGPAGDLALAFQSRTDRKWSLMNVQPDKTFPASTPGVQPLTPGVEPGDPFTPLLQAYAGDRVRLRVQVGAHEEEHNFTINGLKWLHDPLHASSGWRNSGPSGISEYFDVDTPIVPDLSTGQSAKTVDYRYAMGAQTEDLWNGIWGLLRSYGKKQTFLKPLPNNGIPDTGWRISNLNEFSGTCPKQTNGASVGIRRYRVTAVRAADVLHKTFAGLGVVDGLVYNSRTGPLGLGPLVDPTALMYVRTADLVRDPVTGKPIGLRPGTPVDPLVLRASAGECIKVDLENALPAQDATKPGSTATPDLPGFNALPPIIQKEQLSVPDGVGFVTFNANDIRPSSLVGLHPQLVAVDIRRSDGFDAGSGNGANLVAPGQSKQYTWYAGSLSFAPDGAGKLKIVANPAEFGASNLMPADAIKGTNKGLAGALVIEPPGASWVVDPTSHAAATVSFPDGTATKSFREFVTVLQDDVNLRYAGNGNECLTAATLECAVGNVLDAGGRGFPDDAQDSGQKGINYGAEPAWFRLGVPATDPFATLLDSPEVHRLFSNGLVGADPQTPVFTASTSDKAPVPVRMRLVQPGGHARGHEFTIHGHTWQRAPYAEGGDVPSDRLSWNFHEKPTDLSGGQMTGHNMDSWWISSQEGVEAGAHWDLQLKERGGEFAAKGDFLFRDFGSFGTLQGLWGIMRVGDTNPPMAAADVFTVAPNTATTIAQTAGLLANDVDIDEDVFAPVFPRAFKVAEISVGETTASIPSGGSAALKLASGKSVTVWDDGHFTYTAPPTAPAVSDTFTYTLSNDGTSARVTLSVRTAPPVALNDWAAVAMSASDGAVIPVLANDSDPDANDTLTIVTAPGSDDSPLVERVKGTTALGLVTAIGNNLLYVPGGKAGTDTFKYTVVDKTGNTATATVTVAVSTTGSGFLTVSGAEWSKKNLQWTIRGTVGSNAPEPEPPVVATVQALLRSSSIGMASGLLAPSDGVPWQISPGTTKPKSCGDKITVKSSLGPAVTGVTIKCT